VAADPLPEIDDSADRQIGVDLRVAAGEAGGGAAGGEHPVAGVGADRVDGDAELALGAAQNPQVPVLQSRHPLGADKRAGDLHDLH
jgi:hypothetical protein